MPGLKKAIPVNHRKSTQKVKSRNKKNLDSEKSQDMKSNS